MCILQNGGKEEMKYKEGGRRVSLIHSTADFVLSFFLTGCVCLSWGRGLDCLSPSISL